MKHLLLLLLLLLTNLLERDNCSNAVGMSGERKIPNNRNIVSRPVLNNGPNDCPLFVPPWEFMKAMAL